MTEELTLGPHLSEDISKAPPTAPLISQVKRSFLDALADKILCRPVSKEGERDDAIPKLRSILNNKDRLKFTLRELVLAKLFNQSNELQKKLDKVRHPLLHEQTIELYRLCKKSKARSTLLEPCMEFVVDLALSASQSNEQFAATQLTIGQLLYVVNKDPVLAEKCLSASYHQILANLHEAFDQGLKDANQQLQDHLRAHQEVNLQAGIRVSQTRIPLILAQTLMTDTGSINLGIIDAVSAKLLPGKGLSNDHEAHMMHVLRMLRQTPKLREELATIRAPTSPFMPSNDVIRAVLGMPLQVSIQDHHAQTVAFLTLLSNLRQEGTRSCFATSLAIKALAAHLRHTLKDFKQLLGESKLTRSINNVRCDIPFLRRIGDENIYRNLDINQSGQLVVSGVTMGYLWNAPGILAACQAIGIENVKEAILKVCGSLEGIEKGPQQLTVKALLKKLCLISQAIEQNQKPLLGDLFSKACFTFSAQTAAPLLKVWENTIAGMAEMHQECTVKSNIMQATLYGLQLHLFHQQVSPSPALKAYFKELRISLLANIELRYDPSVGQAPNSSLRTPTEGAFVLYFKAQRIDTAALFTHFVEGLINEAATTLESSYDFEDIKFVKETLRTHVNNELFLPVVLATYHPTNEAIKDFGQCDLSPITPWSTQCGNNSQAVLEVYLEANKPIDVKALACHSPHEILSSLIAIGKKMHSTQKHDYSANPHKYTPMRIPGKHTFSLMLGHPSFSKAWMAKEDSAVWIKKFIIKPGLQVSNTRIDPFTKKQFNAALIHRVLPDFVKGEMQGKTFEAFEKKVEGLLTPLSIKEYRNAIVELCQTITGTSMKEQLMKQLDAALWDALEPKLKKQLTQATIHFADSNWYETALGLNVHFAFTVNPGTGELGICEIDSAGGNFSPLNAQDWTGEQGLELFSIPAELFPEDSMPT